MSVRFKSFCPSDDSLVWEGEAHDRRACAAAVGRARTMANEWADASLQARIDIALRFAGLVREKADELAIVIASETGKPLWEAKAEAAGVAAKVDVSIAAQADRASERQSSTAFGQSVLRHRPHGVMAVLGPFNFPAHLPIGHIVPALLAGNTIVFKPSEHTPATGAFLVALWQHAGLPDGVLEIVQGGRETGAALVDCEIDGLLFTGSARAGLHFQQHFASRPGFMLALELGGNNPLVAWDGNAEDAATIIAQSAFLTAGQRCSCARRLIVPANSRGDAIVDATIGIVGKLRVDHWNSEPQPYLGSLISSEAAQAASKALEDLLVRGGRTLFRADRDWPSAAYTGPAIVDMTGYELRDEEIFGPVLQVVRVPAFDTAIELANRTAYGLSASLLTEDDALWTRFLSRSRAGIVNRNRPTNGAAADMPFGGTGASGNHRPSAWYAADYCAYPVASAEAQAIRSLQPDLAPYLETVR